MTCVGRYLTALLLPENGNDIVAVFREFIRVLREIEIQIGSRHLRLHMGKYIQGVLPLGYHAIVPGSAIRKLDR
jgi:hypothetical protein